MHSCLFGPKRATSIILLPPLAMDCPTCGVLAIETGNRVLLHCPRAELVWGHAIALASAAAVTTPAERRWMGMARGA